MSNFLDDSVKTSIAPWLAVRDGAGAVDYYKRALGAAETYRLDGDNGQVIVAQLSVDSAAFWIQDDGEASPDARGSAAAPSVRMILTVDDPDALFARAVAAGATPVAQVHEEHGWRSGRVTDPYGHDWEFAKPLAGGDH